MFNDKQTITADSTDANFVYAVWDRLVFPSSERASVRAGFRTSAFRGPVWFARTTNGGTSWEAARQIYDPGQNDQTIGNQIVVLPNGTLVNIFDEIHNDNSKKQRGFSVRVMRSTNKGGTWSDAILIDQLRTIGVTDPETGDAVRTGDIIPDIAVAPNGDLYAVWQDARVNGGGADGVALSRSTDGGLTWSPRIKVNKTPTNIPDRQPAGVHTVGRRRSRWHGGRHVLRLQVQHRGSGSEDGLLGRPLPLGVQQRRQLGRRGEAHGRLVRHAPGALRRRLLHR